MFIFFVLFDLYSKPVITWTHAKVFAFSWKPCLLCGLQMYTLRNGDKGRIQARLVTCLGNVA